MKQIKFTQLAFQRMHFTKKIYITETPNSWVASDVTKNQTKKLSILLSFYFHEVLRYLNTFTQTNFRLERVLRFAREDA